MAGGMDILNVVWSGGPAFSSIHMVHRSILGSLLRIPLQPSCWQEGMQGYWLRWGTLPLLDSPLDV